ncbi:transcriptional repressor [Streptococcus hyovaginalis]
MKGKFQKMRVAMVYQNLRGFRGGNLVKKLTYGDCYSGVDFITSQHYHIICKECGKIVDFHYPGLDEVEQFASHVSGFKISHHRLEIYGPCPDFAQKDAQ